VSDPGTADTFTYAWSVTKNGDPYASATTSGFMFTPDDDGTYVVTLVVTDDDTGTGTTSKTVTVANVIPVITAPANQTANEGTVKSFSLGSFTDPGDDDPWQVTIVWGDSSPNTVFSENTAGTISAQNHTYADDGSYTVTIKVREENGTEASAVDKTFTVTVANLPPSVPTLVAPTNGSVTNDNTPTFDWSDSTDPSPTDTVTYTIQADNSGCGFGSPEINVSGVSASTYTPAASLADGTYCWHVRADDEDGGHSSYSTYATVQVDATSPLLAITFPANGGSYTELDWNAGCSTSAADVCGTASDPTSGLSSVWISLKRNSDGFYWNWTTNAWANIPETNAAAQKSFTSATWASWNAAFAYTNFTVSGSYTIHARATDNATNQTNVSNTFTLNRYTLQYLSPLDQSNGTSVIINTGKNGRAIPTKVIVYKDGVAQTNAQITEGNLTIAINIATCANGSITDAIEVYEDTGASSGNTNQFRWTGSEWHYNMDTKALGMVNNTCYRLDVYLKNPVTGTPVRISTQQYAIFQPIK
jgi:hypothetical protein